MERQFVGFLVDGRAKFGEFYVIDSSKALLTLRTQVIERERTGQ
jgi:hypothetical protein